MPSPEQVEAFWRNGRLDARPGPATVLFGRMHEDWSIEASLFPPGSRVLCIASAGCTALALADRGNIVTAVDTIQRRSTMLAQASDPPGKVSRRITNLPVQLALLRGRCSGWSVGPRSGCR